jgi:hypothetical protein
MQKPVIKITSSRIRALVTLGILAASLAGCVVYPNNGYAYGYGPGYYAAPLVAPTVVVGGGWGRWR